MYLGHLGWGPIQDIDAGRARTTNGSLEASEGNALIWLVRWAYEKGRLRPIYIISIYCYLESL